MDFTETFWAIALPTKEEVADMEADTTELQSETREVEVEREPSPERAGGEGSRRVMTPEFDHRRGFISKKSFIHSFHSFVDANGARHVVRHRRVAVRDERERPSEFQRSRVVLGDRDRARDATPVRSGGGARDVSTVRLAVVATRARRERRRCAGSNARSGEPRRRRERRGRGPEEGERGTPEEASAGADDVYV